MEDVDPVADFAKRYYSVVNDTPSLVHSMYHPSARFCWPTANGLELELKTAMTVKRFFGKHTDIKLKAQSTIRLPLNNDILLVVRGITLGAQNPGFVQVLHLTESNGQFLVKDDVLSVTAGGTGSDESTGEAKLTQALVVGRTDSLEATQEAKLPSFSKSGIEQDITKKSRFGRKLKPSQHTASINELLSKPEYAPVVAVSPAVLVAPVIECPKEESTVLIQYDERMLKHVEVTVPGVQRCREVPGRIKRIMKQFKSDGLYERCDIQTTSEMATFAQLELMHEPGYVQFISKLPSMSDEERLKYVDTSVYFSQGDGTRIASFIAVGSVIKVCDSVGLNAHKKAFAVVRPPGHHAMKSKRMAFACSITLLLELLI